MAQFGIENPLYLDSNEAESRVRRGIASQDLEADKTIDVGSPSMPTVAGLRGPRQTPTLEVSPNYQVVVDQSNTERPAPPLPGTKIGKFEISDAVNLSFDPIPQPAAEPPKEDGFLTNIGKSVATGAKSAKVTWSFLADKLASALGADTSETSRILADDVKRYKEAWRDPQLQEISKKVDEAPDFTTGAYEMLKGLALNPSAMPYFLAEQAPTMITGGVAGKVGQSFTTAALSRAGVKAVENKAVQTAMAGAAINAGATAFGSLGANYTEGLQKFDGDREAASDYAAKKTLGELPTNIVAGALIGWTPFKGKLANIGTQATIQGLGGASGAALAAKSVGEEANRSELLLEFLGEFASAPGEMVLAKAGKEPTIKPDSTGSTGSVPPGGTPGTPTTQEPATEAIDAAKRDESVEPFRRYSDDQIRETISSANGMSFLAALHRNSDPADQKLLRQTVERTGNLADFESVLNDESAIEKGQGFISQYPEFTERFLQSARIFAATKPTNSRVKAMPIIQTQGTTNESQASTDQGSGVAGGPSSVSEVPAGPGVAENQGTIPQAPGSTGTVENSTQPAAPVDNLRFSKAAKPATQDVSERLQKLTTDYQDEIGLSKALEMQNKLAEGKVDEVEKFIDDTYRSFEQAPLADLRAIRKQREFLARVADRFKLPGLSATHNAQMDQMIGALVNPDKFTDPKAAAAAESEAVNSVKATASKSVIAKIDEVLKAEAKKQVQALIKARKLNAANEVFKRTGLSEQSTFYKGQASSVEDVFAKAKEDIEQEESNVDVEQDKAYVKNGTVKPTPFKFSTKYITDSDFQRLTDLIVAAMARGEVGAFDAPKVALSKATVAKQFVDSLPEEKRNQIIGRAKENGETTKGWLGNTSVADIRAVLQEQRDEGRDFGIAAKEAREKLTAEEKDVIAKKAAFQTQVSRIMNMAAEAQTYRDAITRLRAEQDAIYAALNGQRRLFFKNNKGQIEIYESASPEAQAGFIISQFEGPKNTDVDEVVKDLNGLTMSGPMQSANPERMVDMKSMFERSTETLRKRAAQITEEIRGLQAKSTRDLAKMFRQGLLEIKTKLHNARTEAVRNGLPVSETFEIYEGALKSIAALEQEKPTAQTQAAIETVDSEPKFVPDLAAEIRANKLTQQWKAAVAEMRSGNMTLGQLVSRLEIDHGVTAPQEFRSLASELSMRFTLNRWLQQNGSGWIARAQWANSLYQAARKAKDLGFTNDLLGDLNLTDGEKFTYYSWLKDRSTFVSRAAKDGVTPQEAFSEFLFSKYSLDQMRDFNLIENTKDRAIIESVFETPDAAVQAWFKDLYEAQKANAPLVRVAMEGVRLDFPGSANVATDPMVSSADAREYQAWRKQQLDAKILRAKMIAESKYHLALARLEGLTDEQFDEIKTEMALSDINENEANLRNALALAKTMQGKHISDLDTTLAEFVDQLMPDEMAYARTPAEIADAMRRASIEAVSEESVRTRKDFIGEELSGEGESGVMLNDDGDFDYEADDQRLAKGKHSGVLTNAVVETMVARITSTWKMAPSIRVFKNANSLPEPLRTQVIEKLGADWNAKGLYNGEDGTVYLFSDFLLSEADVQFTIFHEVDGHVGMRAFLGAKLDGFLNTAYKTNQMVKALADQKMKEEGLPMLEAVEEALSDMAGNGTTVSQFKALVGRLIQALRDAGFDKVANWLAGMTDAEVAYVLKMAKDTARNGGQKMIQGAPGEIRLADERMPYEMFSFKNGKVTAYARYNPITMEWLVFNATGNDIRTDYNSRSMQDFADVRDVMGQYGKLERRMRSGLYLDDKLASDLFNYKPPTYDGKWGKLKKLWHTAILKGQNEYLPVWQFVEQLRKEGRINDLNDVQKALTLYERKTGVLLEDFESQYVKPIMDLLEQAKKLGATNEDLNTWLIARTAEERNRAVFRVNPKNPYGSGMPPHTMRMPGMPEGQVQEGYIEVLARIKNAAFSDIFEQIGKLTDIMGVEKVKYEVGTGMISTQNGLKRLAAYKHYVNLSGVNSELDETPDLTEMVGSRFNVKGKDQRAMGRVDLAPDVLARTIQAYESALIRGQKNKVAQTILSLMESNYDPEFVVINEQSYRRQVNKDTETVDYVLDSNYIQRKDVMVAKVNGIPVTMRFKDTGPGSFAEAVHGMVYPKDASPLVEAVGRYTQFIGQLVTTYNPAWIFVNFARDVQTLYFNAAADKKITKQMAAQMMGHLPGAVRLAAWVAAEKFPRLRSLIGMPNAKLLASYQEMRKEGGLTHFINRKSLEDQVHNIEIALTGKESPMDRVKALLHFMEVLTLPMEMAPRLAAYHVTRQNGFTKSDAAVFSGDITINFNMRGQSKWFRQIYLFFNPAVQGTAKMFKLAKDNPKTFASIAGSWIAFGAAMSMLGRSLNDDDDKDGINKYDKVPAYKRATSIVLKVDTIGGSIPIPYGWNAFYSIGNFMMDSVLGIQPVSTSAKRAAKAAFEAFSPVGGTGLDASRADLALLKTAMPTAALPLVEYIVNENRFGAPIYKDDQMFGSGARTPDSYMAFDSVSPISKTLMQGLNSLTGGSSLREGKIDINPAAIDFAINAVMPGIVAESYKMASVGIKSAMGEDTKPLPTPILGRFEARVPEGYDAGAFRRAKELVDTKFKELEFTKDPKVRQEILKEYPGIGAAKGILSSTTQEIRRMRHDQAEMENLSNLPDSRKIEIKNQMKKREKELYSRAVKAVMNVGTEDNKPFRDELIASD